FGVEAVNVMGNWSAPDTRFHEPIRGHGFRRLLQKVVLPSLIIPRLCNCDMATCLNMVDIVHSLRAGNGIPPRFRCGEAPQYQRRRARTQNDQANIRTVRQRCD
ncbi:hypothetical protein INT47_004114, partial [Mucor saturninus]